MNHPFEPELLIESRGAVRIVTLNRPEHMNSTSPELHRALVRVWAHLAEDGDARAVVITGAGKAFSAGGDWGLMQSLWDDHAKRTDEMREARRLLTEIFDFPLPLVAAVNGPAVGLGCSLAAACDIVLIAESAFLQDPHVAVGLTAADGGAPTWPLMMSLLKAKEYLLTCDRIPAEQAVAIGLANRVVPDGEVLDAAIALAEKLAAQPPQAVQTTKQALNMHMKRAIAGVLEYAASSEYQSFDTPEHRAIVNGFVERSKARAARN
jgi:enoyl-CoA hydratase